MEYIMSPLAEKGGIHKEKERTRFAEQAWIYVYYGLF
jgi:acyl-CoA-dependent ceramide synthase